MPSPYTLNPEPDIHNWQFDPSAPDQGLEFQVLGASKRVFEQASVQWGLPQSFGFHVRFGDFSQHIVVASAVPS